MPSATGSQLPMGQLGDAFVQLFGSQALSAISGANQTALNQGVSGSGGIADSATTDALKQLTGGGTDNSGAIARKLADAKSLATASGDPQASVNIVKQLLQTLTPQQ